MENRDDSRKPAQPLINEEAQETFKEVFARAFAGQLSREDVHDPQDTVRALRGLVSSFYWQCFRAEVGSRCHAFLEFNGVMGKYVDIVERAAAAGIDPTQVNEHSGIPLPVQVHDMKYLAEKLRCIFGPALDANPEARAVFKQELFR